MRRAAALALAIFFAACAPPPRVSFAPPQVVPPERDYVKLLKRWSRHAEVRSDFDATLIADATLHGPEFNEVYSAKWSHVYALPPPEAARVRAQLMADTADHFLFYVETATHKFELNDLGSPKTMWRVSLVNDQGREVLPTEIKAAREHRELDMEFYPYVTVFSKGWRMRFPHAFADGTPFIGVDTHAITLRIAGPPGVADLVWKLE
jgi:hypothetical protein